MRMRKFSEGEIADKLSTNMVRLRDPQANNMAFKYIDNISTLEIYTPKYTPNGFNYPFFL